MSMRKLIHGRITLNSKGDGYVRLLEHHEKLDEAFTQDESVFIDHEHLNCAFHGDIVEVEVLGKRKKEKTDEDIFYGKVLEVMERAKYAHAGKLEEENGMYFLVPDDKKTYTDFIILKENAMNAVPGDKVVAEIVKWDDPKRSPFARVVRVLGKPGDNDAEMLAFALERGFASEPSEEVEVEAKALHEKGITEEDKFVNENGVDGRRDFREILTMTIDPADAKDFDDAISLRELANGNYEVGIHIADVSHYLKEDTKMNEEAVFRETSVYLVDRTIPMLPEVLSNDLCSLVEGEERLVMSAVFEMNKNAQVLSEWFGRGIIKSDKRFTYEEALKNIHDESGLYHKELYILNEIAKKLDKEKNDNGALVIDSEEVKFKLDENGVPVDVYVKEMTEANQLIEELMLLANRRVSKFIYDQQVKNNAPILSIYRIHDTPDAEKMHELDLFIRSIGERVKFIDGLIPSLELNKLIKKLKDENREAEKDLLSLHIARSMQKAIYSTQNVGHYGLAFPFYSHFTSPIRRYPDIMLHRILMRVLKKDFPKAEEKPFFDRMCDLASKREKEAQDAERGSIKYKQVEYMGYRLGQIFDGIVSGVSQWGIYVEEAKSKSEGLIRLRDLGEDFYIYNEKKSRIFGENSGVEFRIGDRVKIRVKSTNLDLKQIDYELIRE
ncbi:Ribonuclease R [bioreactor metagenome]|uniref:exoribonuclease II n=1 Tax=bioreactor metagenome TaxID=1076179 RepID=A0A644T5V2_9ZZZZ|nr:VacB/RNase II family 3'-5' exoribonuclease [Candidatus Elulimicrobiales bacterium]